MTDETLLRGFAEYKQHYPEFFPDDQPEEKQLAYYRAMQAQIRQQRHDSLEGKIKATAALDAAVEAKNSNGNEPEAPAAKTTKKPMPDYIEPILDKNGGFVGFNFDITKLSNYLHEAFHVINYWGTLFIYDDKAHMYRESVNEIQTNIREEYVRYGISGKLKAIQQEIETHLNSMGNTRNNPFGTPCGMLNLSNGILDTDDGEIIPHTPDIPFDYVIATPYRKFNSTPELDSFLLQYGNTEAVSVLAKVLWQRAYADTLKELTIFYGDRDSGKTTMAELIQSTLDGSLTSTRNTSRKLLGDLLQRFGLAGLEHKLLNIGDDLPDMFVKNTARINEMVGSVHHDIEHKGVDSFPSMTTVYHLFTTNNLPPLDDDDLVIWSKIRLVEFQNKFNRGVVREGLFTDTIKEQLLYRAVELLRSWKETPYRNDQNPEEVRRIWHEASNDTEMFILEQVEYNPSSFCKLEDIKKLYEEWCIQNGKRRHVKYLTKQIQKYFIKRTSGNGYAITLRKLKPAASPGPQQQIA